MCTKCKLHKHCYKRSADRSFWMVSTRWPGCDFSCVHVLVLLLQDSQMFWTYNSIWATKISGWITSSFFVYIMLGCCRISLKKEILFCVLTGIGLKSQNEERILKIVFNDCGLPLMELRSSVNQKASYTNARLSRFAPQSSWSSS